MTFLHGTTEHLARTLCDDLAGHWITDTHDDQYHRDLTFKGRAGYRLTVAEFFYEQGILEHGLPDAYESALNMLPTPREYGTAAEHQARVESTVTR